MQRLWLNRLAPPGTTPAFIFEDMPNYLMGMEAIPDEHENWKSVLLSGQIVSSHFETPRGNRWPSC